MPERGPLTLCTHHILPQQASPNLSSQNRHSPWIAHTFLILELVIFARRFISYFREALLLGVTSILCWNF